MKPLKLLEEIEYKLEPGSFVYYMHRFNARFMTVTYLDVVSNRKRRVRKYSIRPMVSEVGIPIFRRLRE